MRKLIILITLITSIGKAQEIKGDWNGLLNVQGQELRLVFHINEEEDSTLSATMDSPDQNVFGLQANSTRFEDSLLIVEIEKLKIRYEGKLEDNLVIGTFYQSGLAFPLRLTKEPIKKSSRFRPQEPKKPYNYYSEDVKFQGGGENIILSGTLTLPKKEGEFPATILISGSGPQNRDEEVMTHKPFLVLSDYLTQQGIAVLRYDDRGFADSTGDHSKATTADFADDVRAAISYLKTRKEIDNDQIGLIGHSEGGLIAPMVASDSDVSLIVLLGAPGTPGNQILSKQVELMSRSKGMDEQSIQREVNLINGIHDIFSEYKEDKSIETRLENYINNEIIETNFIPKGISKEEYINRLVLQFNRPWFKYFITYNPTDALKKVKCPVLALNGEKDVQVTPENLLAIEDAVKKGGNNDITIKEFENMNHLFQTCKTGAMEEYATIEETMSPLVLDEISNWIKSKLNE